MENLSGAQTIRRPVLLINRPVERYIQYRQHLSSLVLGGNWNINGNPPPNIIYLGEDKRGVLCVWNIWLLQR